MGVRLTVSCVWFVIVHLAFVEDRLSKLWELSQFLT